MGVLFGLYAVGVLSMGVEVMNITDLIAQLQRIRENHGDLEVRSASKASRLVSAPVFNHLRAGNAPGYWDSRFHRPESKGQKVCVVG